MTKITSTIFTLVLIISLGSCRQQDDDYTMEEFTPHNNSTILKTQANKDTDSTRVSNNTLNDNNGPKNNETVETDPPPKNGQQWKTGK